MHCRLPICAILLFAISAPSPARSAPIEPCPARADVAGLPLVELPATAATNAAFAVMLTGDGGWRRIDAKVTDPIRARGIPVVGFSTPAFFATGVPQKSRLALWNGSFGRTCSAGIDPRSS